MRENINVCLCVTKMYVSENVRRVYRLHMYVTYMYGVLLQHTLSHMLRIWDMDNTRD